MVRSSHQRLSSTRGKTSLPMSDEVYAPSSAGNTIWGCLYIGQAITNAAPLLLFLKRSTNGCIPHQLACGPNPLSPAAKRVRESRTGGYTRTARSAVRRVWRCPPVERSNLPNAELTTYVYFRQAAPRRLCLRDCQTIFPPMLPYPHGRPDLHRAALCSRENAIVLKRPECFTCSWCVLGSEAMVSAALEAHTCKVTQMRTRKSNGSSSPLSPRAA